MLSLPAARGRAFTLVELCVVLSVVLLLATLAVGYIFHIKAQAEVAHCMNNLRSLHVGFSAYIQEYGHWPQVPEELDQDENYALWWMQELEKVEIPRYTWHCPSFPKEVRDSLVTVGAETKRIDYVPTHFDKQRMTTFNWSTQPWLIETGDFHQRGNLILLPDGSIHAFDDLFERNTGVKVR